MVGHHRSRVCGTLLKFITFSWRGSHFLAHSTVHRVLPKFGQLFFCLALFFASIERLSCTAMKLFSLCILYSSSSFFFRDSFAADAPGPSSESSSTGGPSRSEREDKDTKPRPTGEWLSPEWKWFFEFPLPVPPTKTSIM